MVLKQNNKIENNNWLRWAIGLVTTISLALIIHIGNEGSRLKREMATQQEYSRQTDKKIDRIEDKLDRLIERK